MVAVLAAAGLAVGGAAWIRRSKPRHPVPSVVDDTTTAASQALAPLHFRLRVAGRGYNLQVPAGSVISQAQRPNERLREGSSVSVTVSLGPPPVTVPKLSGLSQSDAVNRLIGAQLRVGTVTGRFDNSAPAGTVLSWTGEGGQLPEGSTVNLVVSNGPPVVAIPAIASGTFASAQAALAAVNLKAVENDEFSNTVPKGQVMGTGPPGGTSIPVGGTVDVNVSKGPDLVAVPNVASMSVGSATELLQSDGFNVNQVTGNPIDTVTRTAPAAGAEVLKGSSITLVTS